MIAENDTNPARRSRVNLTNAFVELKAGHGTSQRALIIGACIYRLQEALSGYPPDRQVFAIYFPVGGNSSPDG